MICNSPERQWLRNWTEPLRNWDEWEHRWWCSVHWMKSPGCSIWEALIFPTILSSNPTRSSTATTSSTHLSCIWIWNNCPLQTPLQESLCAATTLSGLTGMQRWEVQLSLAFGPVPECPRLSWTSFPNRSCWNRGWIRLCKVSKPERIESNEKACENVKYGTLWHVWSISAGWNNNWMMGKQSMKLSRRSNC